MASYSTNNEVKGELGLNNCGIQFIPSKGIHTVRIRKDFSLLYIAKGKAYVTEDGVEYPVCEGQSILFAPGHRQCYRFGDDCESLNMWAHFGGSFCEVLGDKGLRIITASDKNEFESTIERLVRAHSSMGETRELLCLSYLRVLISLLVRDEKMQSETIKTKHRLYAVLEMIHTRVGHDIDWDECAANLYMSRDRFNHVFREYVGVSPEKYRIRVCMERAKILLRDFGMSVGECAETLGFRDVSYFCRRFRAQFGMSPSEYKNK